MKAEKLIQKTEEEDELARTQIREVANWFHEKDGELVPKQEAVESLSEDLDLDIPEHLTEKEFYNQLIGDLVGDHVDPVQMVNNGKGKYVGVIDYSEHDTYYTYDEYHDIEGKYTRGVCAACIHESSKSSEPFTRHTGKFGNEPYGDEEQLHDEMQIHIDAVHSDIGKIKTGATLASGTTIAGNTAFHAGNDGPASGLSADDVDGSEPPFPNSDLGNDSVTFAGQTAALGGSATVGLSNLDDYDLSSSDLIDGGTTIWDTSVGEIPDNAMGLIANSTLANSSLTVDTGTDLTSGGSVSLGGSVTIDHANTSTQGDVTTGGATVIDDIGLDGNGHVNNLNTENRTLDDWDDANTDIGLGNQRLDNTKSIQFTNSEIGDLQNLGLGWDNSEGGGGLSGGLIIQDNSGSQGWVINSSDADYDIQKNGSDGAGIINFKT